MTKKRFLILFLISISLIGCHKLESGFVVKKHFVPAHTQTNTTWVMSGKVMVPITNSRFVPDTWYVTVEGEYKGKTRREDYAVPEHEYEKINIGDFIRLGGMK